jgi:TetR/AcrR family transcriptional regulator
MLMAISGTDGSRARLLQAALAAFSSRGYDGVSLRDIERQAGVNRGHVAHHFGTKERLWQESVDLLLAQFHDEVVRYEDLMADLPPEERIRILIRVLVRFSARAPEFFRLLIMNGDQEADYSDYLVERIRPSIELLLDLADETGDRTPREKATLLYMVAGAVATIFTIPAQCRALFGVDPREADFVDGFIKDAVALFMPLLSRPVPDHKKK